MTAERRAFLKVAGASVLVVGAGAATWALTRDPKRARAPWSAASSAAAGESLGDPRLDALAFAILAPNPHNMQPWRIRLDGADAMTVFADLDRLLPATDPPARQITIGFGCFLELLRQAAAEKGLRAVVEPFPEGEPQPTLDARPVAHVRLVADGATPREALFDGALLRRTNRAPFDPGRPPSDDELTAICAATVDGVSAGATRLAPAVGDLRALAIAAWETEWATAAARRESIRVMRVGKREVEAEPWGLSLSGPLMEVLRSTGVLSPDALDREGTTAYKETLAAMNGAIASAPAFVWTTTHSDHGGGGGRAGQLAAGAAWVRMQTAANRLGIAFHPLSQALQEYPEMTSHYARIHEMLAPEGGTVQMLARVGFARAVPPPAPREPLEAKLIPA